MKKTLYIISLSIFILSCTGCTSNDIDKDLPSNDIVEIENGTGSNELAEPNQFPNTVSDIEGGTFNQ